jgi:hypothetical protein
LYKRKEGTAGIARVIESLAKFSAVIQDAPAIECNMGVKHRTTLRSGLPSASWRVLNSGTAESKSTTYQVDDTTGMLEAWSRVDKTLVDLAVDKAAFRFSEAQSFIEAMNQEAEAGLFYHNTALNPEKILGFAPRFADITATNGGQMIDAAGSGSDNTSIWFITWGENACHLIYPKGTLGGLQHEDLGLDTVLDGSNNPYRAYRDRYAWHLGLTVRDWRSVVRIGSIDVSDLTVDASAGANLMNKLVDAAWALDRPEVASGRTVMYANSTILRYLDHQSRQANARILLNWREAGPDSQPVLHFRNMPIRRTSAITNAEAAI